MNLQPTTEDEVAEAIADARATRQPVEVRGAGSVLDRLPAHEAPVLSTAALTGVVALAAEDLTVTVRAGTPLDELAAVLAEHGQECPIEPAAGAGSTVGGRVATALAGPRQLGAGRVRDWVLRVRFVPGTSKPTMAGGVTVKDVTGYDLCRLLTGSWGTIGVLTEVTLKVRPIAAERAWFATSTPEVNLDARLYRPAGLFTTPERTHVLLEGHPDDVADQAAVAGLAPASEPSLPRAARASVDPARLHDLAAGLDASRTPFAAQDGVGVCYLDGDAEALASVRRHAEELGGTLLVLEPSLGLAAFGHMAAPDRLGQRVRDALDPDGILAPGRWQQ
ncbi:MAG: FAD-binding protein [Nitriliruptoraceae bacterium]